MEQHGMGATDFCLRTSNCTPPLGGLFHLNTCIWIEGQNCSMSWPETYPVCWKVKANLRLRGITNFLSFRRWVPFSRRLSGSTSIFGGCNGVHLNLPRCLGNYDLCKTGLAEILEALHFYSGKYIFKLVQFPLQCLFTWVIKSWFHK